MLLPSRDTLAPLPAAELVAKPRPRAPPRPGRQGHVKRSCTKGHDWLGGPNCPFCATAFSQTALAFEQKGLRLIEQHGVTHVECAANRHRLSLAQAIMALADDPGASVCTECANMKAETPDAKKRSLEAAKLVSDERAIRHQRQTSDLKRARCDFIGVPPERDDPEVGRRAADGDADRLALQVLQALLAPGAGLADLAPLVAAEATEPKEIFRAAAKLVHPDKNAHPQAAEAFAKLTQLCG